MRTCVTPDGTFCYIVHKPAYTVRNLRQRIRIERLGSDQHGKEVANTTNYPNGTLDVPAADWIFEIANPFPFRGSTYIGKAWADRSADNPERIRLPKPPPVSLSKHCTAHGIDLDWLNGLPRPLLLGLATTSTDPEDLTRLAQLSCTFEFDAQNEPLGLRYRTDEHGSRKPQISDFELFEAVANNPALPGQFKIAMVIRPGAQGASEIVGDFHLEDTHVYEYLRRNSYIGGGHYAANMADDAIRYSIGDLSGQDMQGLRQLYYQRTYVRLAERLGLEIDPSPLSSDDLEQLRLKILLHPDYSLLADGSTLWGWNFGFDYAPSGYRLHASHQQVHHQFALIPPQADSYTDGFSNSAGVSRPFACGVMISEAIAEYRRDCGRCFFNDYLQALRGNQRMDGRGDLPRSLVVWEDEHVLLFVPKAQTSQWELQVMTKPDASGSWPGNILEANDAVRRSLDTALFKAQRALAGRGARMVTTIEYARSFGPQTVRQPLIYSLLPKLPESPGAFSEAQLRFINGHYPEDFAAVCRQALSEQVR